jgi:hypothetical protein
MRLVHPLIQHPRKRRRQFIKRKPHPALRLDPCHRPMRLQRFRLRINLNRHRSPLGKRIQHFHITSMHAQVAYPRRRPRIFLFINNLRPRNKRISRGSPSFDGHQHSLLREGRCDANSVAPDPLYHPPHLPPIRNQPIARKGIPPTPSLSLYGAALLYRELRRVRPNPATTHVRPPTILRHETCPAIE